MRLVVEGIYKRIRSLGAHLRHAIPLILVLSASGLMAAHAADKPRAPKLSLRAREVQVYGWHNGDIEVFIVDKTAALHVFLPGARGCQSGYRSAVGGETVVDLYKGKNVRDVLPLGGPHPPLPPTHLLEKASAGVIECTATQGADGVPGIRITLKDLSFPSYHLSKVGPVKAPLGIRPP